MESYAVDFSHKSYSMSRPLQDAHKKKNILKVGGRRAKRNIREQDGDGKWERFCLGDSAGLVKGRAGQRTGGRREAESKGGAGREQRRKLASCFHSWDIQSNEPAF